MGISAMRPSGMMEASSRLSFGRALMLALALEFAVLAALWLFRYFYPPVTLGLKQAPVRIHMVILAPPHPPSPKPKLRPLPIKKPRPRLRPPPKPHPRVVHHPVPLPRPVPPPKKVMPKPKPPAPPPSVPKVQAAANAVDRYAVLIRTRIQEGLQVPPMVRALDLSGKAVIAFELTPAGHLLWARVMRSSGLRPIDQACLAAVQTRTYPAFTSHMPHHPMRFDVTVSMRTSGN